MTAALNLDVNIQLDEWLTAIPEIELVIEKTTRHVLEATGLSEYANSIEVSILLTDDEAIKALNDEYRDKDKPTNVLSFPQEEMDPDAYDEWDGKDVVLGDVICALETIKHEAQEQDKELLHHFTHMLVHGILHLQGHDHGTEREAEEMEALETEILEDLSIPDPYSD